jgi:hypothetical protein
MFEVDLDIVPPLETERAGTFVRAVTQQRGRGQNVAPSRLPTRDPLQLTELLERVDANVRVRSDAEPDRALAHALHGQKAVAQVRLRRRAGTDARACLREQVELLPVCVRRVHHGRAFRQTASAVEQLDRADAVFGETLLDLAGLLVGMYVQRQAFVGRVASDRLQPLGRACAH